MASKRNPNHWERLLSEKRRARLSPDALDMEPGARRASRPGGGLMRFGRALAALLSWGATGCSPQAPTAAPSPARVTTSGSERGTPATGVNEHLLISADSLAGRIRDPAVVVLHVGSSRAEYEAGHIPGARFLPLSALVVDRDGNPSELAPVSRLDSVFEALGVSDRSRVIIYGPPLAAARTFFTLDYLGHGERAALLNGGLRAWVERGGALSKEQPTWKPARFTPSPQLERVVDARWVHANLRNPHVALIDARPEAQFTGDEPGAGVSRPGHIPGAGSVFWERTLLATDTATLKGAEALHALYRAAGAAPGEVVVTYCRSGMQASMAYYVARYLGYETRMYDGSFLDWSRRPELPVER